jgi:hypothetical protein
MGSAVSASWPVTGLELPANLIDSVDRDRNPGRRAWLAALPGILSTLARQWGLRLETPFQPGGDCSGVSPVRALDGRQLVLKAGWLHAAASPATGTTGDARRHQAGPGSRAGRDSADSRQ